MTMTQLASGSSVCGLDDLAVGLPDRDPCLDYTVARRAGALARVSARLRPSLSPEAARQLDQAASVMAALPDTARHAACGHPYFMYWLVKQYERCVAGDGDGVHVAMADIGRFVALPALTHDCWPGPMTVRARNAQIRFPGSLRHVMLPAGTADGPVRISQAGGEIRVETSGGTFNVPAEELLGRAPVSGGAAIAERPVIPGTRIEVDATDPYVLDLFASINSRPPVPGYPPNDLAGMSFVTAETLACLATAHDLIGAAWPAVGAEMAYYTRLLVPFTSRARSTFAESAFLGAVFMGECRHSFTDDMYTAEHLLHEESHMRLTSIMEQDTVFKADPSTLVASPWRRDPRPVIGIVQGAFAFARVARFLRLAFEATGGQRYAERRDQVRADLAAGIAVLREAPDVRFTPVGTMIMDQCEAESLAGA